MPLQRLLLLVLSLILLQQSAVAQITYQQVHVAYDSAWTYKNLQLIPIYFKGPGGAAASMYTLQQGIQQGKVRIKEIERTEGADINVLEITNKSNRRLMITTGDMLAGGKQDRVVAETKVLQPGETGYVDVFCIEKGRWDDKARSFQHAGTINYNLKKLMDKAGRQHEVWKEIDRLFAEQSKSSATWSYLELYKRPVKADSNYIKFFMQKFRQSDSSFAGFLAITGNQMIQCELFASSTMTTLAFEGMLNSLVNVATTVGETPILEKLAMKKAMDKLLKDEASQKHYVNGRGRIHYYEEKVIHVVAYDLE